MFGDQILNTEMINETLSNRQTAKLSYLQKENEQLQQENEDLKDALRLNKEALRIAYSSNSNLSVSSTMASGIAMMSGFKQTPANNSFQEDIAMKILSENEKLLGMIGIMSKERNKAQSIALIKEQISEENSNFLQEQIAEKDEKIKDLRMLLQDKEYVIQEFEKAKGYYDYGSNVLVRIRDITTPNDQSIKLHNEIENLKDIISKVTEDAQKLRLTISQKDEHLRILRQEILKLRLVILNPVNFQKMRGMILNRFVESGDEDAFICGTFYKEADMMNREMQQQEELEEQRKMLIQQQKEQYEKQHAPLRPSRHTVNPPTPLSQRYSTNNPLTTPQIDKLNEKICKLEEDLSKMSRLYRKEIENNNQLVSRIDESKKETEQCFQNNETLISANVGLQSQIEVLQNEISVLKRFQMKYFQLIRSRGNNNNNNNNAGGSSVGKWARSAVDLENMVGSGGSGGVGTGALREEDQPNPTEREVNVSILEDEDAQPVGGRLQKQRVTYQPNVEQKKQWETIRHDLAEKRGIEQMKGKDKEMNLLEDIYEQEQVGISKDQAKIYLMNLAKDLYVNTNIKTSGLTRQVLKQIEIGGYKTGIVNMFRTKRAMSDPLDYVLDDQEKRFQIIGQIERDNYAVGQQLLSGGRSVAAVAGTKQQLQGVNFLLQGNRNMLQRGNHNLGGGVASDGVAEYEEENGEEIKVNLNQGNHDGLFNVDMSIIEDAQKKLRSKGMKRKQEIQIDASFISEGSEIGEFN